MEKQRFTIFAPEGMHFTTCQLCGSPCVQDVLSPWPNCTWCTINTSYEDLPSDDEKEGDASMKHNEDYQTLNI